MDYKISVFLKKIMEQLYEISNRLIQKVSTSFKRGLYTEINWNNRLIEIKGSRGVGKTTLMLQKAKEEQENGKNVLYFSADLPFFYKNNLFDTADRFQKHGGEILFIDEVHKYPQKQKQNDWAQEIKNIYDAIPDLKLVYSGSSILQLYQSSGDLSRRKTSYLLNGLSLREYLIYNRKGEFEKFSFSILLENHIEIATEICRHIKILPQFESYLIKGYYPFYNESPQSFSQRLGDIINVIIESDIPYVSEITQETAHKIKQLLAAVSSTVPYTPNLSNTASELYITDQRTLIGYLNYLEKAELITTLGARAMGNKILNKPAKIYLNNTNLMYAIDKQMVSPGTIRETFFLNQVRYVLPVKYPKTGDFYVDNKYLVEVGGKNKGKNQLKDIAYSFVAKDDIETGYANVIPLWLFGFLY
jgi:predicted AAA+ superfamily ATPase